jgi:low affinity Fe/Cu permease
MTAEYERPIDAQDGEKTSAAYIQLEKHNERLKEALIRSVNRHAHTEVGVAADTADSVTCLPRMNESSKVGYRIWKRTFLRRMT